MDKGVLAGRTNAATDRAQEAATAVVKALDLDPELAAGVKAYYKKDKGITLLRRMEGIADLLEAIVPALTPKMARRRTEPRVRPQKAISPRPVRLRAKRPANECKPKLYGGRL